MGDWDTEYGGATVETPPTHFPRLDERGAVERTQRRRRSEVERLRQIEAEVESEKCRLRCDIESSHLWMASVKNVWSDK